MSEEDKSKPIETSSSSSISPRRTTLDEEEEIKIAKAVRFWKHPSLKDVPTEQKRLYLNEKGITDSQIHQAWDRILEEEETTSVGDVPLQTSTKAAVVDRETPRPSIIQTVGRPPLPTSTTHHPMYSETIPYPNTTNLNYPSSSAAAISPYQSQYSASYPPRYPDEDDSPGPFLRGMSLVAFGSLLGLTAAAAARWLNGGDFEMLPPPMFSTKEEGTPTQTQNDRSVHDDNHNLLEGDEDHGDSVDEEEGEEYVEDEKDDGQDAYGFQVPDRMLEQMESIADTMKAHVAIQEKILQKLLLPRNGSTITNQSMELLRTSTSEVTNSGNGHSGPLPIAKQPSPEALQLWAELLQIKGEIQQLQVSQKKENSNSQSDDDQAKSLDERITTTISKLDSCIESIGEIFTRPQVNGNSSNTTIKASTPLLPSSDEVSPTIRPNESVSSSSSAAVVTITQQQDSSTSRDQPLASDKQTLRESVLRMAQTADPTKLRLACQLMYLYLVNLTGAPTNPRYRKIFMGNENFKKVETVDGAKALLLAVGFEEQNNNGGGCLEWIPHTVSPSEDDLSVHKVHEVLQVLGILKTGPFSPELEAKVMAVLSPDADTIVPSIEVQLESLPTLEPEVQQQSCSPSSESCDETKTIEIGGSSAPNSSTES